MKKIIKFKSIIEFFYKIIFTIIPYRFVKFDKEFHRFTKILVENEKKSESENKEYQLAKLKAILYLAYNNTTFYKKKYNDENFHPSLINSYEDINKIPILTKDEVRSFSEDMVVDRYNKKKLSKGYTSGTTGKSLEIYRDKQTLSREWASICYQWKRIGYKVGEGRIELRGYINDDLDFLFLPKDKVLRINIIKMNEDNIKNIISRIKSSKFRYIHGYPSAIFKFAKIVKNQDIEYQPKGILLASEMLYDWQIDFIDKVFDCPKIIHYGQAEKVALGAWTNTRKYSFVPSYGIVEIDKLTNELIGTSLINEVMPLIRYRLTDTVECFNNDSLRDDTTLYPVINAIGGREEDFTYDENKNLIPPAVVTFLFKKIKYIKAVKIIQISLINFDLFLETNLEYNNENLKKETKLLVENFKNIYGSNISIKINYTDSIPLGKNGKFRWIECKIR